MWTDTRRPLGSWVAETLASRNTHATLSAACERFGLIGDDLAGSKRERAAAAIEGMTERQLAAAAEKMAKEYGDPEMEEAALSVLEADDPAISEITRIDIARCFDGAHLSGERLIIEFLRELWPLDTWYPWGAFEGLVAAIEQHMVRNDDWSVEDLFRELGALGCSRKRFVLTIEAALHPRARRGEEQEQLKSRIDAVLRRDGYKIEETDSVSGYPIYRIVRISNTVAGAPKNLIFASAGPKA